MISNIPTVPAPPEPLSGGRVFNDDLLTNPGDVQYATDEFPAAIDLLDHPELRDAFASYEAAAKKARTQVRRMGLLAVASATAALLSAATEPLWHHLGCATVVAIIFELCLLLAAVIAGGSLWLGPWRKRWLENRFMAERLRQWHFQLLVRKGGEIEGLLGERSPKAVESFKAQRKKWFDAFLHEHANKIGSRMDSLVHDPDLSTDWVLRDPTSYPDNSPVLEHVFAAYYRLRFNLQYDHATHMLSTATDRPFWQFLRWPLLRQESAIHGAVSFCFIAALLCSICVIVNRFFGIRPGVTPFLVSMTLAIAIIGVALRTIQDGLGITKDIERYRDYRGKVRRLLLHFEETGDQQRRLRLMEEMELIVVDEMKGFLRTHLDAAFVL